ncbi:MAG: hypothetical protein COT74_09810 [Bdellovibrionales bacterium CG10_big_fil_rev_8_21_14_0_10_45_34]|nr:MAG: hypothetical protein COT74_09810 [Bdellovibrionales bacterium CG10_big_fil_rev_8_21_14_0_10_45_34]
MIQNKSLPYFLLLAVLLPFCAHSEVNVTDPAPQKNPDWKVLSGQGCSSSKEFVTTLEFLRSWDQTPLLDASSQNIALQVAEGCTGAAARFVRAFEMMAKVGVTPANSIPLAVKLSQKSDGYLHSFVTLFENAYSKERLDLDLWTSLRLAQRWSLDTAAPPEVISATYNQFVAFCLDSGEVEYSKPQCAEWSSKWLAVAEKFQRDVFGSFERLFHFLIDHQEAGFTLAKSLTLTHEVLSYHPDAEENFRTAYVYALKQDGLAGTKETAVNMGLKLAGLTNPEQISLAKRADESAKSIQSKIKTALKNPAKNDDASVGGTTQAAQDSEMRLKNPKVEGTNSLAQKTPRQTTKSAKKDLSKVPNRLPANQKKE